MYPGSYHISFITRIPCAHRLSWIQTPIPCPPPPHLPRHRGTLHLKEMRALPTGTVYLRCCVGRGRLGSAMTVTAPTCQAAMFVMEPQSGSALGA